MTTTNAMPLSIDNKYKIIQKYEEHRKAYSAVVQYYYIIEIIITNSTPHFFASFQLIIKMANASDVAGMLHNFQSVWSSKIFFNYREFSVIRTLQDHIFANLFR